MSATTAFAFHAEEARAAADGAEDGTEIVGVVEQVEELGFFVVAEAEGPSGISGAAARLAVDQLRTHVGRHGDIIDRFTRHPTASLRSRLQGVLREGFTQASREVFALAQRRETRVGVSMDAVLLLSDEAVIAHAGRGEVALLHEGLVHRLTGRAEPAAEPPSRDHVAPLGPDDPVTVIPLLGESMDPPSTQALTVGLAEGDRILALGASLAAGLSPSDMRREQGALSIEDLAAAVAGAGAVGLDRPRLVAVCQVGAPVPQGQDRLSLLRSVDLFKWCTDDELLAFVGLTRPRRFRQGELLLRQSSVNTTLYLLVRGTVGVNKDGQRIARTGAGSIFGEMSMLDEPRASATVEALTDIEVLTIPRDAFLHALKRDATMAVKVLWSMLLRVSSNLRATSQRLAAVTAAGVGSELDEPEAG